MEIEQIPTSEIYPYIHNNRTHPESQVERIVKSISEFGFNQPLVLDRDNVVLVGHGRLLAAQKLGLDELPCIKLKNLTEEQKRTYRILDNKLQNDSSWDFESLELELGFLEEQGVDLEQWGLDDLKELFQVEEPEVEEDDFDGVVPEESYIKRGDLIELGPHRLLCGDSTSAEDVDCLCNGVEADLLVTDPPYNVAYVGKTKDALTIQNDEMGDDQFCQFLTDAIGNAARVLKKGASYYIFHADSEGFNFRKAVKDSNLLLKQTLIWVKNSLVMGRQDYQWKHEPILYGWKEGAAHYFTDSRKLTTVWEFDRPTRSTEHPTMKPLALVGECINNSSKQGEKVLDGFLGSGSTLIAADQLNRVCYGMEIDPKYCQVILERYQNHCSKVNKPFICRINGKEFKPQA